MAIFHQCVKIISRSSGRSAVAAASYRSGDRLRDGVNGQTHDYARKGGIAHTEILAPEAAPEWTSDREKLWNAVEASEKRKDAQLAREVEVALPAELSREKQTELVRGFVKDCFVKEGMIADIAIHDKGDGNPHAHVMLTMRDITPEGFGKKNRGWNDGGLVEKWRGGWESRVNAALALEGVEARVDRRTLEAQGIERTPQIHAGRSPHRTEANEQIKRDNETAGALRRELAEINVRLPAIERDLEAAEPEESREEREYSTARFRWEMEKELARETVSQRMFDREEYEKFRFATFDEYLADLAKRRAAYETAKGKAIPAEDLPNLAPRTHTEAPNLSGTVNSPPPAPETRNRASIGEAMRASVKEAMNKPASELESKALTVEEATAILKATVDSLVEKSDDKKLYNAELARLEDVLEDKKTALDAKKPPRKKSKFFGLLGGESEEDYEARLARWEKDPLVTEAFRIERHELDIAAKALESHRAGEKQRIEKAFEKAKAEARKRHPEAAKAVDREYNRRKAEREAAERERAKTEKREAEASQKAEHERRTALKARLEQEAARPKDRSKGMSR